MRSPVHAVFLGALGIAACTASSPPVPTDARPARPPAPSASIATIQSAPEPIADADAGAKDAAPKVASIEPDEAEKILFVAPIANPNPCREGDSGVRIKCMITLRYGSETAAKDLALGLYERTGDVAGVEPEQDFDGGYRGQLHLVPELPIGARQKHLAWTVAAMDDFDTFFAKLAPADKKIAYRHRALAFQFFRSVRARTPSAFAEGWTVSYNVDGSLMKTADGIRETLFHEVFHLNDADHGGWSKRALGSIFDALVAKCGTSMGCLRPYAPSDTTVRNGTYYAFQPGNGVHEYAAELALRYYQEERAAIRGEKLKKAPFKCGPDENKKAWAALTEEFFGGIDLVPACP